LESEPVKMLSKKFKGPPPLDDCARAGPHSNSTAAMMTALFRLFANSPTRRVMFHPQCPEISGFRRPPYGFQ
jgi:hypothetical protein